MADCKNLVSVSSKHGNLKMNKYYEKILALAPRICVKSGLSLKRDPVDRDRAEDRVKRPGAILQCIARKINWHIFLSRGIFI